MPSSRKEEEKHICQHGAKRWESFLSSCGLKGHLENFFNHLETFSLFTDKAYLGELWPIYGYSHLISLPGSGYAKYMVCLCHVLGSSI